MLSFLIVYVPFSYSTSHVRASSVLQDRAFDRGDHFVVRQYGNEQEPRFFLFEILISPALLATMCTALIHIGEESQMLSLISCSRLSLLTKEKLLSVSSKHRCLILAGRHMGLT